MKQRMRVLLVLGILGSLVSLFAVAPTLAAGGNGNWDALVPSGKWQSLAVGQSVWYQFQYAGDKSQILIDVPFTPSGSVAFAVYTPQQIDTWGKGGALTPIGRGSVDSRTGDLIWTGNFDFAGTYYVVVSQMGALPGYYNLMITGSGVSFPAGAGAAKPTGTVSTVTGGAAHTAALTPTGNWAALAVGQSVWYQFTYAGDKSQILIDVPFTPSNSIAFNVYTPDQAQHLALGEKVTPIGAGAVDTKMGSDLVWTGNFDTAGTYFVNIMQTGPVIGQYNLMITGSGVSFPKTGTKPAGTSPAVTGGATHTAPLTPTGAWRSLAVGQSVWYQFSYAGDKSQVLIDVAFTPSNSIAFNVYTPDQARRLALGEKVTPIGAGSVDAKMGSDLVWSGNFDTAGAYLVNIMQTGPVIGEYNLMISGTGVSFPGTGTKPAGTSPAVTGGATHTAALAPTGTWVSLAVGQSVWYQFTYAGDKSQVLIDVAFTPSNSVAFNVYTPDQARRLALGEKVTPIGAGAVDTKMGSDLVWSGNFDTAGTYLVNIMQTGAVIGEYKLMITGTGVTLPAK